MVSKGEIIYKKEYGFANVELNVPVSDSSVFEIGSISKQFISAVYMILKQQNKVDLDDQIQNFIPTVPGEWYGITLKQMLTHTSGIPDYETIAGYDIYKERLTIEEVVKIAHSRPVDFEPGTGWNYSNTGYYLLSIILERIEKKPLAKILDNYLFDPLNMNQTRLSNPENIIPHRVSGYWIDKTGNLINRKPTEISSTLGAGGIVTSLNDLVKWDNMLYSNDLLSDESKRKLWTEIILPSGEHTYYGMGWSVGSYYGVNWQYHSGQVAGFVTRFARIPEKEISIIILLNRYQVRSYKLSRVILHTFISELGPIPD